ncbi:putative quinate permease [Colletotrichum fructicola]|uniref:Quinate permease n=1 Tax=Colletotrichum fructicola (strain Nara gc5) TaxID=1213859 RepID=L2G1Z5_COLFN|nr:putative quinate permease [Colletotrichum fructicola]KAE9573319.1 putative quinate permease [Colletotrichum fructicola]KAF4423251.1 putative quinate permease [Colletotrichum fructicola]KAF4492355.1 putative quinate permease [Colletotrichum fructicola Nara gc5]KAF4888878.1 putative quinate permease [Colletotrichum fructicola]
MGFAAAEGTTDPPEVRNWTIHYIALVASMAALSMGYDTAVIGGTMSLDSFVRDFGIDNMTPSERDNSQANIASMFQVGAFFGALLTFPVAEKYGRKRAIMTAALVFCVGGAMMSGANGMLELVYAGRAIGGLGIGMATMTVPVYIAETSPPSIRGRLVGVFEIFSQGGGMLGFWINYATDRTIDERERAQWIVPLALQLLPAVLLFFGIMFCPESPRWLARGDDFEAAEKVLVYIRGLPADHPYVQNEMSEIRQQVEERSTMRLSKKQQFRKLLAPGTRNRVGVGAFLMFLQSFTGVNIMTYFSPRIFETLGIVGTSNKLFSTGIYGVAKMLGMILFAVWVVEKIGRRGGLLWGSVIGSLPLWYVGGYVMIADPATNAAEGNIQLSGWGYFAMVCIYLHSFIICATIQGITWTYAAEIFPLDVRMFCVAISTASTWLGSFVVARATPFMITDLGYGTYFMFAGFLIGIGLWSFFCVPETKGVSLEEMDALFSRPTHIAVWAHLRGRPILPRDNISVAGSMDKNDAKVDEVV